MQKIKASITSDFKNSRKRKDIKSEMFLAKYNQGDYFKLFIDREDGRRQIIDFTDQEFNDFKEMINNY